MAPNPQKRKVFEKDSPEKVAQGMVLETPRYDLDTITIHVGEDEERQKFVGHRELLSKHSMYFRAALGKEWLEGKENKVSLEEDPEIFRIFEHFIYSGQISEKDGDRTEGNDQEWSRLARAWIFGDAVLSTSFKDGIVDAVIAKMSCDEMYPTEMQELIYPKSSSKAKIRKLLVDIVVWEWLEQAFEGRQSGDRSEFFFDLALTLHKTKGSGCKGKAPYEGESTCIYREHGDEGTCYKDLF